MRYLIMLLCLGILSCASAVPKENIVVHFGTECGPTTDEINQKFEKEYGYLDIKTGDYVKTKKVIESLKRKGW